MRICVVMNISQLICIWILNYCSLICDGNYMSPLNRKMTCLSICKGFVKDMLSNNSVLLRLWISYWSSACQIHFHQARLKLIIIFEIYVKLSYCLVLYCMEMCKRLPHFPSCCNYLLFCCCHVVAVLQWIESLNLFKFDFSCTCWSFSCMCFQRWRGTFMCIWVHSTVTDTVLLLSEYMSSEGHDSLITFQVYLH